MITTSSSTVSMVTCVKFRWAVVGACGSRGEQLLDAASTALCERRNPALQIAYVAILGVMYWMYSRDVFAILPTRHVPAWHMCGPWRLRSCVRVCVHKTYTLPGRSPSGVRPPSAKATAGWRPDNAQKRDCMYRICVRPAPGVTSMVAFVLRAHLHHGSSHYRTAVATCATCMTT